MNFPFGTNGKFIILGVPILKHIRVCQILAGVIETAKPNQDGNSKLFSDGNNVGSDKI